MSGGRRRLSILLAASTTLALLVAAPASGDEFIYSLTYATPGTTYNAIARWDPVAAQVRLYAASDLIPSDNSADSWLPDASSVVLDLSQSRPSPGIYTVTWESDRINAASLVVTSPPLTHQSRVMVLVPDFTWAAYNTTGGGSFYTGNYPANPTLSLDRPIPVTPTDMPFHDPAASPIRFLSDVAKSPVDVALQSEVVSRGYQLSSYDVLVLYGHDEYWPAELRSAIEGAVAKGTNLLDMAGNVGYREIVHSGRSISWVESGDEGNLTRIGVRGLNLFRAQYLGRGTCYWLQRNPAAVKAAVGMAVKRGFLRKVPVASRSSRLCRLQLVSKKDPLFAGVTRDKWGFVPLSVAPPIADEVDGLLVTPKWKVAEPLTNWARGAHVSVLAGTYVGLSPRAIALVTRSTLGSSRIVTIGAIGWVVAMNRGNSAALRLTRNALSELLR